MSQNLVYYHNPKCSKSRAGLEILENSGVEFSVKEYLTEDLSLEELKQIVSKLDSPFEELIRHNEEPSQTIKVNSSQEIWLNAIINNPIILQRPLLVSSERAVIGRPPEKITALLP